jgi:hypothetical protein
LAGACAEESSSDDDATGGGGNDDATGGGGGGNDDATGGNDDATGGNDDATGGNDDATGGNDDATGGGGGGSSSGQLQWYSTCGDPVCGPEPRDLGLPACAAGVSEGTACSTSGEQCDAQLGCGASLICASSDPKTGPGGCPISRAAYKADVSYVSAEQRAQLTRDLLAIPLASYVYREDEGQTRQLGFIMEDVEPSPSVYSSMNKVNLYGYTSMVVAAVQEQQLELERLRAEVAELREELAKRSANQASRLDSNDTQHAR